MFIYQILNMVNGKSYIGKAVNVQNRIKKHLFHVKKKVNRRLYDSINCHGWGKFQVIILEECIETEVNEKEKFYIKLYKTNNPEFGYNMTEGGDGGKMPPESIEKMRVKKKLYRHTEESKRLISEANKGRIPFIWTDPQKKQQSERIYQLHRAGLIRYNSHMKGKKGILHPLYGQKHTEETKKDV